MIRKRNNIDERFFIRVNSSYDPDRLVYQFPPAINFYFCFHCFMDSTDLPVEWICARQGPEVALHLVNRNTVIAVPDASDADLRQMITDLQRIFLWDEDFKFHIGKI